MASILPGRVSLDITGIPPIHVTPGTVLRCALHVHVSCQQAIKITCLGAFFERVCIINPLSQKTVLVTPANPAAQMAQRTTGRNTTTLLQRFIFCRPDKTPIHVSQKRTREDSAFTVFNLEVPVETPDSWEGGKATGGSVRYELQVNMTYLSTDLPRSRRSASEEMAMVNKVVLVRNPLDVRQCTLFGPLTRSERKTVGPLGWAGEVRGHLTIHSPVLVLGEDIAARVQVFNFSSLEVREATLSLWQEYHLLTEAYDRRVQEEICTVQLSQVKARDQLHEEVIGLCVPLTCLTNASFAHLAEINIRFFVRLKLKWFSRSLKCDVDVEIGTTRSLNIDRQPPNIVSNPPVIKQPPLPSSNYEARLSAIPEEELGTPSQSMPSVSS